MQERGWLGSVVVMRRLRFYFDYISSNAYLAWLELPALAAKYEIEIEPVPVLFAGLLGAHGQLGPAEVPAKALWMWKNNLRKAARLGAPLNRPAFHPFNPLLALRATSLPMDADRRLALVDGLLKAVWVRELHVSEPEVVAAVAAAAGLDGSAIVTDAMSPAAKSRLRSQTDAAIAAGVFGVPSMEIAGELFWGHDDLPQLEGLLAGNDPLASEDGRRWSSPTQASSVRRQFR